jgi:hypothetical protein
VVRRFAVTLAVLSALLAPWLPVGATQPARAAAPFVAGPSLHNDVSRPLRTLPTYPPAPDDLTEPDDFPLLPIPGHVDQPDTVIHHPLKQARLGRRAGRGFKTRP